MKSSPARLTPKQEVFALKTSEGACQSDAYILSCVPIRTSTASRARLRALKRILSNTTIQTPCPPPAKWMFAVVAGPQDAGLTQINQLARRTAYEGDATRSASRTWQ